MALLHAKEDERLLQGESQSQVEKPESRERAADQLLNIIEKKESLQGVVKSYKFMSKALINLAYVTPSTTRVSKEIAFPKDHALKKVSDWSSVAVPTDTLLIRPDCDYSSVAGVGRWEPAYSLVGGVNAPKKLSCWGTDGRLRPQLVKGKD